MNSEQSNDNYGHVMFLLFLQLIAWGFALAPYGWEYSGSDPAGRGMAKGYALLMFTVPAVIFVFFSNWYFLVKKNLPVMFKAFFLVNIVGLAFLYFNFNNL